MPVNEVGRSKGNSRCDEVMVGDEFALLKLGRVKVELEEEPGSSKPAVLCFPQHHSDDLLVTARLPQ